MSTTVRIAKAHHPVTVLGWGERAGLWLRGCTIRCRGCLSRDTWNADDDKAVPIEEVVRWLDAVMPVSDGLTVTGGEPFEQPDAVRALAVHARRAARGREVDVLVYSGLSWGSLRDAHENVLRDIDAVIAEPFDADPPGR